MTTAVQTDTTLITMRFLETYVKGSRETWSQEHSSRLRIDGMIDRLSDVQNLLALGLAIVDSAEATGEIDRETQISAAVDRAASEFPIVRLSYQSPVIITLGSITASATYAAYAVLRLWQKGIRVRHEKLTLDVDNEINRQIVTGLKLNAIEAARFVGLPPGAIEEHAPVYRVIESAIRALEAIDTLEVEGSEPPSDAV